MVLTHLVQGLARSIVALAAFSLIGLAFTPLGKRITYRIQEKESPFGKDFKVRGSSDDRSDEMQFLLLLLIVNSAVKDTAKIRKPSLTEDNPIKRKLLQ